MSSPAIHARGLTRTFTLKNGPVHAVRGIDLTVGRGEILGFLGPNGAGKTTTLRMLVTLLPMSLSPGWLDAVSRVVPFRYTVDAVREAFLGHYGGGTVALGAAVTLGLAALCLYGGIRLFTRTARP